MTSENQNLIIITTSPIHLSQGTERASSTPSVPGIVTDSTATEISINQQEATGSEEDSQTSTLLFVNTPVSSQPSPHSPSSTAGENMDQIKMQTKDDNEEDGSGDKTTDHNNNNNNHNHNHKRNDSYKNKDTAKNENPSIIDNHMDQRTFSQNVLENFSVNNPFGFTPLDLACITDDRNFDLLKSLGLDNVIKGLHADSLTGLSVDETAPWPPISLERLIGNTTQKLRESQAKFNQPSHEEAPDSECVSAETAAKLTLAAASQVPEGSPHWQRKRVFGTNTLPKKKSKSILRLMWIAMQDRTLILLTIAAIISLGLGLYEDFGQPTNGEPKIKWVEGVAIVVAIVIVVTVGSINDWQKEKQFRKLNASKDDRQVKVTRNSRESLLSVYDILVGDLLNVEPGDIIPADGILVTGFNILCDESAYTGESIRVRKLKYDDCIVIRQNEHETESHEIEEETDSKLEPFLISGSKVLEGTGKYIVTGVGVNSLFGRTLMSLRAESEITQITPLQEKLNDLAEKIAKLGVAAALLMLIVLLIKYFVAFKNGTPNAAQAIDDLVQIIISTITIIVVAVPEGLPLAVTLALAYATTRMLKDNNLVRVLSACETMGNATTICSDKTGTLTQNKMTVVAGTLGLSTAFARDPEKFKPQANTGNKGSQRRSTTESAFPVKTIMTMSDLRNSLSDEIIMLLDQSIAINSTAFEGERDSEGKMTFIGSNTETSLLSFLLDLGLTDYKELRQSADIVQLFPFSSERKAMGIVIKLSNSKYRFLIKGASELILRESDKIIITERSQDVEETGETQKTDGHIRTQPLTPDLTDNLKKIILNYASQSLRTIALAYRDFEQWPPTNQSHKISYEVLSKDVTLLGIFGIEDPLRDGVREAVELCKKAGVVVRMVTGDNVRTAESIATQCGIYTPGGKIYEGPMFRNLSSQEMDKVVPKLQVLARSSPEDKRILVAKLKEMGEIVAVTGDGTNDGLALTTADVGFSMGISGTEVAKEASSIILMDDNFSSILKAIIWGRSVNDSVKKFLQFQLTVNITAVLLAFISAVSSDSEKSVLTAVQLLWVNLIMDTLAALALATDPPTNELLDRKPEKRNAPLISFDMWKMIIGQSVFQLTITLVLLYAGNDILNYSTEDQKAKLQTLVFNTFVFLQIFNELNCRRLDHHLNVFKGVFANKFFLAIFAFIIGGQIIIVQLGSTAFQVKALDGVQWAISIGLGILSLPVGVILRLVPNEVFFYKKEHRQQRPSSTIYSSSSSFSSQAPGQKGIMMNPEITKAQEELAVFKLLRGGRLRASLDFDKRKRLSKTRYTTAAMLPGLFSLTIGAPMRYPQSRPNSQHPSSSALDLQFSTRFSQSRPNSQNAIDSPIAGTSLSGAKESGTQLPRGLPSSKPLGSYSEREIIINTQ